MSPRILIAGAGIAGLALAQGLLNHPTKKFKVIVFEKDAGPQGKSIFFQQSTVSLVKTPRYSSL